jgi:hypothetical protein
MIMKTKTLLIAFLTFGGLLLNHALEAQENVNPQQFGGPVAEDQAISYDDFMTTMSDKDSLEVVVKATVAEVCQMKGCWMNLTSPTGEANATMVKFQDYGFFVPKDIAGQTVVVQGKAYREVTPVDELRHYAEDAGKSKEEIEAITEPKEELKFMATGVLLKK